MSASAQAQLLNTRSDSNPNNSVKSLQKQTSEETSGSNGL